MSLIEKYIIVDDDPFNNIICRMQIERILGKVDIETFEMPEDALNYLQDAEVNNLMPIAIFLDLNTPTLTGWEFIEAFEKLDEEVKKQISIYILSSSVDPRDKEKADANNRIKGFMSKPLNREAILSIAGN